MRVMRVVRGAGMPIALLLAYLGLTLTAGVLTSNPLTGAAFGAIAISALVLLLRARAPEALDLHHHEPRADQFDLMASGRLWRVLAIILALLLCWVAGQVVGQLLYAQFGSSAYDASKQAQHAANPVLLLLLFLVLAPVGEELLVRGGMYPPTRALIGPLPAMIVTAGLFALLHGNILQMAVSFPLGILSAVIYERTGRIAPSIALHIAFNLLSVSVPTALVAALMSWGAALPLVMLAAGSVWMLWPSMPTAEARMQARKPDGAGVARARKGSGKRRG